MIKNALYYYEGFQAFNRNIEKGTTGSMHWALWLDQHFPFKTEASTSFEILNLSLLLFGKGQNQQKTTLTNPCNYCEIGIFTHQGHISQVSQRALTQWLNDKARQWLDFGSIRNSRWDISRKMEPQTPQLKVWRLIAKSWQKYWVYRVVFKQWGKY